MGPTKWLAAVLLIAVAGTTIVAATAGSRLITRARTRRHDFVREVGDWKRCEP
jgi:hypothetical protein